MENIMSNDEFNELKEIINDKNKEIELLNETIDLYSKLNLLQKEQMNKIKLGYDKLMKDLK